MGNKSEKNEMFLASSAFFKLDNLNNKAIKEA